jgi:hypothetical protein
MAFLLVRSLRTASNNLVSGRCFSGTGGFLKTKRFVIALTSNEPIDGLLLPICRGSRIRGSSALGLSL